MRVLALLLSLLCGALLNGAASHARAQTPPAAAAPAALTPAQAQAVLDVLQDEKKREQFTAVLQDIIRATPAAKPPAVPLAAGSVGAQLVVQSERWASQTARQLSGAAAAIGGLPLLWRWAASIAQDPDAMAAIGDTAWKLAVVFAAGLAAEWLTRRLLGGLRRILAVRAPADEPMNGLPDPDADPVAAAAAAERDHHRRFSVAWRMLRRLPFVLAYLLVELVPVALFAAVANGLVATPLADTTNTRLVVLAAADAYVACRVILCITRGFVSPAHPRLRLVQCEDSTAQYIEHWVRRLAAVAVFGYAAAEIGLLYGLTPPAHDVLVKLVGLAVHVMLIVIVLQTRHPVAHRLRARRHRSGPLASLQNHIAASWHRIAIFYIVALWLVTALELRDGYTRLLHFFVVTSLTVLAARLVGIVVLGTVDRYLRVDPETAGRFPAIEQRVSYYYPAIRLALTAMLSAATAVVLLEVWGFSPVSWFSVGQLGARLLGAVATSAITVVVAVLVWETLNAAIENKVDTLERVAQTARAARLRTLLPILRTTLLVTLVIMAGLIVLSQVGVNIAPLLAGAGVVGVAIGFGSQKLVQDLITGLFLLLENTMQVGDVVTLASLMGTVEHLSIRTIRLRALDGSLHIIPFSSVTTVTNLTRDFAYALIDLPIGLDEEPDRVADLLSGLVQGMRGEPRWQDAITADLEVMGVYAFADTHWTMRVRIRTTPSQRWAVNREFNRRVKYCFDQNAVQSPITSYRVQGWLPPGSERPMPKPEPPPPAAHAPAQDHVQEAAQ